MLKFLSEYPLIILLLVLMFMIALILYFSSGKEKEKAPSSSSSADKSGDYISKNTKKNKKERKLFRKKTKETISKAYETSEKNTKEQVDIATEKLSETQKSASGTDNPEVSGEFKQPYKSRFDDFEGKSSDNVPSYKKNQTMTEEELLEKMKFVPTSKKVSKLERVVPVNIKKFEQQPEKASFDEDFDMGFASPKQYGYETSNVNLQQNESVSSASPKQMKYFDHSSRLSKSIKSGSFDDMFRPHLSDKYLNIDTQKHLNVGEDFEESLYGRTSNMIANSDVKVGSPNSFSASKSYRYDRDMMKEWAERRKREETARLMIDTTNYASNDDEDFGDSSVTENSFSPKNMLISRAIFDRKGKKTN